MPKQNLIEVNVYDPTGHKKGPIGKILATTWKDPVSGETYKVPLGYDPQNTINNFNAAYNSSTLAPTALVTNITKLLDYRPDGPLDLQRNFNGHSLGGFVDDFRGIASFDYGLAAAVSGLSITQMEMAGGIVNAKNVLNSKIDTNGFFLNNTKNIPNIENGSNYYHSNSITNAPAYFFTNAFKNEVNTIISDLFKSESKDTSSFTPTSSSQENQDKEAERSDSNNNNASSITASTYKQTFVTAPEKEDFSSSAIEMQTLASVKPTTSSTSLPAEPFDYEKLINDSSFSPGTKRLLIQSAHEWESHYGVSLGEQRAYEMLGNLPREIERHQHEIRETIDASFHYLSDTKREALEGKILEQEERHAQFFSTNDVMSYAFTQPDIKNAHDNAIAQELNAFPFLDQSSKNAIIGMLWTQEQQGQTLFTDSERQAIYAPIVTEYAEKLPWLNPAEKEAIRDRAEQLFYASDATAQPEVTSAVGLYQDILETKQQKENTAYTQIHNAYERDLDNAHKKYDRYVQWYENEENLLKEKSATQWVTYQEGYQTTQEQLQNITTQNIEIDKENREELTRYQSEMIPYAQELKERGYFNEAKEALQEVKDLFADYKQEIAANFNQSIPAFEMPDWVNNFFTSQERDNNAWNQSERELQQELKERQHEMQEHQREIEQRQKELEREAREQQQAIERTIENTLQTVQEREQTVVFEQERQSMFEREADRSYYERETNNNNNSYGYNSTNDNSYWQNTIVNEPSSGFGLGGGFGEGGSGSGGPGGEGE